MDNVFVFAVLFTYFGVPAQYQHRLLFWGVFGAIVFRAIFIVAGTALLQSFHFVIYVFGALLLLAVALLLLARGAFTAPAGPLRVRLKTTEPGRRWLRRTPKLRVWAFVRTRTGSDRAEVVFASRLG